MRRLKRDQNVRIDLDGLEDGIDCYVESVTGPVARLGPAEEYSTHVRDALTPGSLSYISFQHAGQPVGLRGVTRAAPEQPEELDFVVIDGVQLTERRTADRIWYVARVRVAAPGAELDDSEVVHTVTANLSLGGALITKRPGIIERPEFRVELLFRDDPNPIRCGAKLARETRTHVGVAFTDMQEADRIRLAGILADHHRREA